jgi:hypothetical protein
MEKDTAISHKSPAKSTQSKHDSVLSATRSNISTPSARYSTSIPNQLHFSPKPYSDDERSIQSEDEVSFQSTPIKILKNFLQGIFDPATTMKTGQKAQFDTRRVKSVLLLIKSLYCNEYLSDWLLIRRKLTIAEYDELLRQIARNPSLKEYLDNKLRYAWSFIIGLFQTYANRPDTIIILTKRNSWYEWGHCSTSKWSPMSSTV